MPFDFALQPERKSRMMDTCFSSYVDLFDIVFGQGLQHLGSYIFFDCFCHPIIVFNYKDNSNKVGELFIMAFILTCKFKNSHSTTLFNQCTILVHKAHYFVQ